MATRLAPLPKAAAGLIESMLRDEWRQMLITGWNKADWMAQTSRVGDRIARLIGAVPGHAVMSDTLSIKVYQVLAAALEMRPGRKVILSDSDNFPSDLYMAEGLVKALDKDHEPHAVPALSGWLDHEAPFAFDFDYRPSAGIERMRVGTPPVIQLSALEAFLDIWDLVDMDDLRAASIALCDLLITEVEAACPDLVLASPRTVANRGSQVSFHFPDGYATMQALIARGVIGDFRAPDIMRFGFVPLFLDAEDVRQAVAILAEIMGDRLWDRPEYKIRAAVT